MTDTVRQTSELISLMQPIPTSPAKSTNRQLLRDIVKSFDVTRRAKFNIQDAPYFGVGDGIADDTPAIVAACTALSAVGGGVLFFPPTVANTYRAASSFSIPSNVVFEATSRATVIKRDQAGDMVTSIGAKAGLRSITLDGNAATYGATGRGIVWSSAVGAQVFFDAAVINFPQPCLDFNATDSGSEFKSIGCTYYTTAAVGTSAAVKVTGTDSQAIPRHFYETSSAGCTLFDFGGCNDFFASGFYTNGFIFRTASSKVTLTNFRCGAAAGRQTITGSSHQLSAGVFAVAITLDASSAGCNLGDCEVAGWDVNDLGVGNRFTATFDYGVGSPSFFTAAWSSDGTLPTLGNGTLTGIVTRVGRKVRVNIRFVIGSTSTLGTGQYFFNLPYLDYSAYRFLGECWVQKTGTLVISTGVARVIPGLQKLSCYFNGSSTPLSNAQPVAWAAGDEMNISLEYTAR